jgi:tRNA(Ile)-lysidine synthase TilS/MesJ
MFFETKNTSGPRSEFEEESRKIRYDLYQEIINEHNCSGVFVGHHKDDIIENIFTNSKRLNRLSPFFFIAK